MGDITLILGGIKTGKTSFAEKKALDAESKGFNIVYLATAEAKDDEMSQRIDRHKTDRPKSWTTIEEPIDLTSTLKKIDKTKQFVLLDCLTLWLTNKIVKAGDEYNREELMESIITDCKTFIDVSLEADYELVIISNLVEVGLISPYKMGRLFQDLAGLCHQEIADKSKNVVTLQAGIATAIKGSI